MKRYLIIFLAALFAGFLTASEKGNPTAEVMFFIATDCPIANSYAPEINRIFSEYSDKGIAFLLVYPDTTLTSEELENHRKEYALEVEGKIDLDHSLVKKAGATTTPEVAVFDAAGRLIYRGMIDDLFTEFGDRRRVASEKFLRNVLTSYLEEESVLFSETKPVGCLIESIK